MQGGTTCDFHINWERWIGREKMKYNRNLVHVFRSSFEIFLFKPWLDNWEFLLICKFSFRNFTYSCIYNIHMAIFICSPHVMEYGKTILMITDNYIQWKLNCLESKKNLLFWNFVKRTKVDLKKYFSLMFKTKISFQRFYLYSHQKKRENENFKINIV